MESMLDRYLEIAPPGTIDTLRSLAAPLKGMSFLRINATRQGGGVAEMLHQFMPIMEDLGLKPKWDVIEGHADFYAVTKAFHNALQGNEMVLSPAMKDTYL